jgi:hypothetical protein
MITVYYVTAANGSDQLQARRSDTDAQRHDLMKFFVRQHAEAHIPLLNLSGRWAEIRIEERTETVEQQHPAHRALFDR